MEQINLFGEIEENNIICRLHDWRGDRSIRYGALREKGSDVMNFDFIIGNPPYQEETDSDSTRKPPIYNNFMDEAYLIGSKVELITPARFLFNAGYTPKAWNEKMLNDPHFQVLFYEPDSYKVFSGVEIKGGVAVSYRDTNKEYGAIETFTKYKELNEILKKVKASSTEFIDQIISATLSFKLSALMLEEHPNTVGRLRTSAFSNLAEVFYETIPDDGHEYVAMVGLLNGKRTRRYIRRDYLIDGSGTLDKYTLLVPNASGNGEFGEKLSEPVIAEPGVAFSQTFNAFGCCDNEEEVINIGKYIKTRFARALLGVLKITQHLPAPKWKYVPLQDFTSDSDIDWSKSIAEIDQQLYAKYGLDESEIAFIESHVKEMS
jgi:type II restriction enzyme